MSKITSRLMKDVIREALEKAMPSPDHPTIELVMGYIIGLEHRVFELEGELLELEEELLIYKYD